MFGPGGIGFGGVAAEPAVVEPRRFGRAHEVPLAIPYLNPSVVGLAGIFHVGQQEILLQGFQVRNR